jgi:hypothetical protein
MVLLGKHPGPEAIVDVAGLEPGIVDQDVGDQVDDGLIVVHDQDPAASTFEGVGRDAVFLHEAVESFARNPAEPRARNPEPFELARVETTDDSLLAHLADLGGLTGREHGFHVEYASSPQV